MTTTGRGERHLTPFAIANDAASTGDMADINRWRESIIASHSKRSSSWSKGYETTSTLAPNRPISN